jgi:hypothetical protein
MKKDIEIESIIKAIKELDSDFTDNKKTGHINIRVGYYEGGRQSAIQEVSSSLKTE